MSTDDAAIKKIDGGDGRFFDAIAARYDLLNRIISLGQDGYWRNKAVKALQLPEGARFLDLATGTADLAIVSAKRHRDLKVVGLDPSAEMLANGRVKVSKANLDGRVELVLGDAQNLPFEDNSFDGVAISFGIRNVPDRRKALQEMNRVARPGGRVVILELSEPRTGLLASPARFYIHHVVPRIGGLISGSKEYRYLQESIAAFPTADAFANLMREVGLTNVNASTLSFGAVNLFTANAGH
ncbi:bifunctional demethylmenaquinone methyltransferase/2-methoxy-6-polyprenyl-1,4-benzoquinol methylase UbiE [Bradymonadaceae bacterium TMQ3]|uniref:Demethylmenaquinone methyltransferase n=1 Tax=Lujinxingia sediminis TaxID=2480984 RepID=A0ABY0CP29_9DELT|nr:bifunctional demethylmenaquinone methyltransferase/2-methoxy-6-polyprenyl-1,4-benzoquinol methylase UbiE [Bradymonadaceae bacterium TMQ3]RVU41003.1 bifunctional demethylmenaquinone methyltransferase/2-methoxy-6-polyprenyl-1,4-benzoquinol methylase UbiE [Lujinxingia sediminis]TXC67702.1 bifunctional demethylmenaquinone methyltransferase/2-methoxy-6-polyprenyl-1,4-benzoquinol methylase UbiE [Bradymonadales bacterium TMQ1]